jgi:hypothetical protein
MIEKSKGGGVHSQNPIVSYIIPKLNLEESLDSKQTPRAIAK